MASEVNNFLNKEGKSCQTKSNTQNEEGAHQVL